MINCRIGVTSKHIDWSICFDLSSCIEVAPAVLCIFHAFDIDLLKEEDTTSEYKVHIRVEKKGERYSIIVNDLTEFPISSKEYLIHWLYEVSFHHLCLKTDGTVFLHGAAFAIPETDHAVLLLAPSHGGKTTLCTEMALRGYYYLSDDVLPVSVKTNKLYPFPKSAMIRNKSLFHNRIDEIIAQRMKQDDGKTATSLCLYNSAADTYSPYIIDSFFLLRRIEGKKDTVELKTVPKKDIFGELLKNIRDPSSMSDYIRTLAALSRSITGYEIQYSSFISAASVIQRKCNGAE